MKQIHNYQQLNLRKKPKQKQTKLPTRTGIESQKWKSHGGLSMGRGRRENGGKSTGSKKLIGRHEIDWRRLRTV